MTPDELRARADRLDDRIRALKRPCGGDQVVHLFPREIRALNAALRKLADLQETVIPALVAEHGDSDCRRRYDDEDMYGGTLVTTSRTCQECVWCEAQAALDAWRGEEE